MMTSREFEDFVEREATLAIIRDSIMDDPTLSNKSKWILIAMIENGYDCAMERQKNSRANMPSTADAAYADGSKAQTPPAIPTI